MRTVKEIVSDMVSLNQADRAEPHNWDNPRDIYDAIARERAALRLELGKAKDAERATKA